MIALLMVKSAIAVPNFVDTIAKPLRYEPRATVLHLPLDPSKELKSFSVRAIANEVMIGPMSVPLERPQ